MTQKLPERLMVRNGAYYCRIWVPKDIASIFGRQLVVTSLRTKDLKTAKSRLARRTVEAEDSFDRIRAAHGAGSVAQPDRRAARARFADIAREHALEVSDGEFVSRAEFFRQASEAPARLWSGELMRLPSPADFGHGEDDAYTYFDHLTAEGDLERVLAFLARFRLRQRIETLQRKRASGNLAEWIALAKDKLPGIGDLDAVAFARLLLEKEIFALEAIAEGRPDPSLQKLRLEAENPAGNKDRPMEVESAAALPAPVAKSISLDELFARWEAETDPSASTLSSWRGIARDLKSFLGDKAEDVSRITPQEIVAWKDKLVKSGKAAATISRGYLGCARALFRFAIANKLLTSDPTEGVKVARKVKPGTKMLGYGNEEVARLLEMASNAREPWKRWLPWLAAATGSRIGEVAQLHGSHFFEEEGHPVVRIAPAEDAGSIKNTESERTVPIHSALVAAGLLDFVKEKGQGPLFYGRSSGDPKRKHASKGVANRLAAWIRDNGFTDPRKAPNHALRHWFKTEASRAGIPDSITDAIQGHSDGRASAVYRHIGIEQKAAAIEQIKLPPPAPITRNEQ